MQSYPACASLSFVIVYIGLRPHGRLGSVAHLTDQYGRVPAGADCGDRGKVDAYQNLNISGGCRTALLFTGF